MRIRKLRRFYNIITLSKAIPIKYINKDVCEVCALLKVKKYRKRTAAPNKLNPLKLIFMDIYGPLSNGINGSRYFLKIINNYTRKSDAISFLTNDKSDNAPKLK